MVFLDFFRSLFKNGRTSSSIALCYMTGILPIKKYNTESALNNFDEYTMLDPATMAPYIGFTQEEVKPLCEK
ncbi:MAG: AAA family ATPase, partial [Spirochaetales bacterium]|nr:AAA family ATPase [Spirochaetales bacterium]